ncbi:polysaccharide deacetylase family protein [Pusillimonas noertemannii]|uniref:polysaccharide deacetylase family protein n=1 Tax=Pusillimonas noertemannii TaxID=305977 RepID=UPI0033401169
MTFASTPIRPLHRLGCSWLLCALLLLVSAGVGHAQTIALTFDDGFDVASGGPQAAADNTAMLAALKRHRVRSMLFPSGVALANPENLALVRAWGEAGHAIGNHTYSHGYLSKSDTAQYFSDVGRAQAILEALPGWCPRLRFPYLDEGGNPAQHDLAMRWLAQHGYGVASATVSVPDWEYAQRYLDMQQASSQADAAAFRRDYIQRILAEAKAQETRWVQELKRSPAHVLLLHANHLNAAILPELLNSLKSQGWTIVDAASAFQDPIYQRGYTDESGNEKKLLALPVPACH